MQEYLWNNTFALKLNDVLTGNAIWQQVIEPSGNDYTVNNEAEQ